MYAIREIAAEQEKKHGDIEQAHEQHPQWQRQQEANHKKNNHHQDNDHHHQSRDRTKNC